MSRTKVIMFAACVALEVAFHDFYSVVYNSPVKNLSLLSLIEKTKFSSASFLPPPHFLAFQKQNSLGDTKASNSCLGTIPCKMGDWG